MSNGELGWGIESLSILPFLPVLPESPSSKTERQHDKLSCFLTPLGGRLMTFSSFPGRISESFSMPSRIVIALGFALLCGSVLQAQEPLGGKAPAQQPPGGPPSNLFGAGAPPQQPGQGAPAQPGAVPAALFGGNAPAAGAEAPSADSAADNAYLEELKTKKVIYKASVKGKLAALWVGEAFTSMTEDERTRIVRVAYKQLVVANDAKFKSPMTIFLSDGQRMGPRLGVYTITPKGDKVVFVKPRAVAGPIGVVEGFGGGVPTCPACPPPNAFFCP